MTTKEVHISTIMQGDTILHNHKVKTVTGKDIKTCPLFGKSVFGDSYKAGHKPVIRIIKLSTP